MTLILKDFKPGDSTGAAPSIHCYTSADTIADINTSGYFNDLSAVLAVGDLIYIVSSTGGTRVSSFNQVLTNAAGVVDVANGTVLASTDTD